MFIILKYIYLRYLKHLNDKDIFVFKYIFMISLIKGWVGVGVVGLCCVRFGFGFGVGLGLD